MPRHRHKAPPDSSHVATASKPGNIGSGKTRTGSAARAASVSVPGSGWPVAMKEERQSGWSRKTCGRSEPMSAETVVA